MERKDRKRKREESLWTTAAGQDAKLQDLQEQVKKTLAVVDSARNLDGRVSQRIIGTTGLSLLAIS